MGRAKGDQMSNRRYDYDAIEREYVTGDMSLRQLAEAHHMKTHSLITDQSRKRDWVRKRDEYRRGVSDKTVAYMADQEGARRAKEALVRDNAIEAIDEAITKMREDMRLTTTDGNGNVLPLVVIRPKDLVLLIDRLNVLFGRPAQISEERTLGVQFNEVDSDVLRSFIDATRGLGEAGGASESPIPRLGGPRSN
jgi:hypothetical protein